MSYRVIVLAWLLGSGVAAHAADQPSAPKAAAENPGDKRVCKRPKTTGSRIRPPAVCRTQRDWDVEERAQQNGMDEVMRRINHPQQSAGPQ